MTENEAALQIVLKAMEQGLIHLDRYAYSEKEAIEKSNAFNAKQISDFFNSVVQSISNQFEKFRV